MAMHFEELDETTRGYMVKEFESEQQSGNPYQSKALSPAGQSAFCELLRAAIEKGNETTLSRSLANPAFWNATESYIRNGLVRERNLNPQQAADRLALTEFNTWYVRGLCARLIDEGVEECQAYRAATPKWEPAECTAHEERVFSVKAIFGAHRARYWPEPGNPNTTSIPFGPGCHHTIRRFPRQTR